MTEFRVDFDTKNKTNDEKKCDYSIGFRYVLKMLKKDRINTIKNDYKSNFISKMEKVKKMPRKTIISVKISIQKS